MRLEQFVGALLWAVLVLYIGYCWLTPTRKPQSRPKVRSLRPSPQLPSAFRFGYDPYNTVHAHLIAMRHRFDSVPYPHNLIRDVVLQPISPELEARITAGLPPVHPWNGSRYNKT